MRIKHKDENTGNEILDIECDKNEIKAFSKFLINFGKVYDKIDSPEETKKE